MSISSGTSTEMESHPEGPNDLEMRLNNHSGTIDLGPNGTEQTQDELAQSRGNRRIWWKLVIGKIDGVTAGAIRAGFSLIAKAFVFQEELSPDGFEHFQCLIALKSKARKNQVLMLLSTTFGLPMVNFQIKPVNNTLRLQSIIDYCSKVDTRVNGPWSYKIPGVLPEPPKLITKEQMYSWQAKVVEVCNQEPNDRTVYWIYDTVGNSGKTALCKYLIHHLGAFIFRGKSSDMASRIVLMPEAPRIAVMNVSRTQEQYVSYQSIEEIKDGLVCSGKYEGGQKIFNPPHMFIFANFEPDRNSLSHDRWHVVNITGHLDWRTGR